MVASDKGADQSSVFESSESLLERNGESGERFHSFCGEEISELLPKT